MDGYMQEKNMQLSNEILKEWKIRTKRVRN